MSVLKIENVSKSFDGVQAVNHLNLDLSEDVIFGLLGPNGAGKTTTIRMIMDIIIPDEGKILLMGRPSSQKQRDRIGYLPEERGLYNKMKIGELLAFMAELKGVPKSDIKPRINNWLDRFELMDRIDKKVEELSRGMQQKIQFISTIIHDPELIILDEPFTGLDPINTQLIKDIMLEQQQMGKTIIFSTHLMEQVEQLCDSICLINKGEAVLKGELKEIKKNFRDNKIRIEFDGKEDFMKNEQLIERYKKINDHYEILPKNNVTAQQILLSAVQEVTISRFEIMEPSLNEIFIKTVKKQ